MVGKYKVMRRKPMNTLIARKAIGVLMAATLLAGLFVIGNIEKAKLREAGIQ